MDAQQFISTLKKEWRDYQLTLGQLISEIEKCGTTYGPENEDKKVCFDFGSAVPTSLASWRGSYDELALGYRLSGYDAPNQEKHHFNDQTAEKLLKELKSGMVTGVTFPGWKGGDYQMDEDTPLWVANVGNVDNTCIVGVLDIGWQIVICTAYCEY